MYYLMAISRIFIEKSQTLTIFTTKVEFQVAIGPSNWTERDIAKRFAAVEAP